MSDPRAAHWRYNVRLTVALLAVWFAVTYVLGAFGARWLNEVTVLGFPLDYYVAAQGALVVYVVEIALYAWLMNRKDRECGVDEK